MPRSNAEGLRFLVSRPDSGQFVYYRRVSEALAPLITGMILRSWKSVPHCLDGRAAIKVSLGTKDPEAAQTRWAEVHAQIEALYRLALIQTDRARLPQTTDIQHVAALSDDDKRTIAAQVHHDVLASYEKAWLDPRYRSGTTAAVEKSVEGAVARDVAEVVARQAEASTIEHALRTRTMGFLEATADHVVDPKKASELIQSILVTAAAGQKPSPEEIAALASLATTPHNRGELDQRLEENGVAMSRGSLDRRALGLQVLKAKQQAYAQIGEPWNAAMPDVPTRPVALNTGLVEDRQKAPKLSEVFDMWVRLNRPKERTRTHNWLYIDRFIACNGDLEIDAISKTQLRAFRDMVSRFPRNIPVDMADAKPSEIAAWCDAHPEVRKISRVTVNNRALGALSTIFDTAMREALVESNPCRSLKLPLKASDSKNVRPFTIPEVNAIFASKLLRKLRPSSSAGGDAGRWIPLLALFTGARLEELAQLHVSDIVPVDGIMAIRISTIADDQETKATRRSATSDASQKSLKTKASKRTVPIHDRVIEQGFMEYVERCKKAKKVRLFPDVDAPGERKSKNWSRWFGRLVDREVGTCPTINFHSFRHTFIDGLRNGLVGRDVIKAIVGHANADVTDGYGHGVSVRIMHSEIHKLSYPKLSL